SIPYAPPIAYNAPGGTGISVNTDDVWSGVINLPFPFCFFGQTYNSAVIGSNGAISFNTGLANGFHPWSYSASVPSTALNSAGNIFGPYHDIDPSVSGSVRWYLTGQAPCRKLIVVYQNLGYYSCTSLRTNHMMVLYETTNIIEVYVDVKPTCNSWNNGNTVIGIQNPAGNVGYTPPGRNTGSWTLTTPEAWQFVPDGPPIYTPVEWYEGSTPVGTGATINVCPPNGGATYTARTTYTRCDGLQINVEDSVHIDYEKVEVDVTPKNVFTCAGSTVTLNALSANANSFTWNPGGLTGQTVNVTPSAPTTYSVIGTNTSNGCSDTATATITFAEPVNSGCNVLYVSPTGSSGNDGTKASPLDLETALEKGACNGTIVKMALGDYTTDSTINKVTSYITLEGGFDPTINWDKISTAGATRILRTATRSTSTTTTSLIQGSGIPNEFSANPEVVAIEVNNQTGFRFQDLTIRSELTNPNIEFQGEPGVDVIGVRLNSCDQYNLVRTQINTSQAGKGGNQAWSIPAEDGGDARGLVANTNGAGTNLIQSNITAGAAGAGGNSNANGSPTPLAGSPGTTQAIQLTGTAFVTNQSSFNLAGQPRIQMDDVACTATNMDYNSASSNSWNLGIGSSPTTGSDTTITTQYSILGRKNIAYGSNNYIGFANIILDSQVLPDFDIDAPIVLGEHRICVGDNVAAYANNGGVGYIYHWTITNTNTGFVSTEITNIDQIGPLQVDTTGHYIIELRYETSCCGISAPTTKDLYVEEVPIPVMPADENICLGQTNAVTLNVGGITTNGSISWSPTNGLSPTNASPAYALPNTTTTYFATLTDSTGMCDAIDSITITVIDLILTPSSTQALCGPDGSASVSVTGGSGNYSYLWSDGQMNQTATNLQSGTYSVVVTDITEGCKDSIDVVVPTAPASLVATSAKTDALCTGSNNGEIIVELTGGSSPYTYDWSHLGTNTTKPDTFDIQQNLAPGIYTLTITDNNNCTYTTTDTINEPSSIVFSIDSVLNPSCYGSNDGFIGIRPDGGTRPYTFTWSNGMPVNYFNAKIEENNLPVGDYTLTLTDDNGCVDSITISLSSVYLTDSIYDTLCIGESYTTIQNGSFVVSSDTVLLDTLLSPAGCDSILTSFVY
ncbi:MAG: SprB repeat-containing protein, partial [Bacteroidetes bacterium]|nr:SprB repeat-containing protein [Bacteroidota bacterium]